MSPRLSSLVPLLAVVLQLGLSACATRMGSQTVPKARFNYNEAIVRSRDEQLLLNLIRLRYRDTPLFLEMGSIVTQFELGGRAGASPIVNIDGSDQNEFGFDIGVNYSERPTITYTPLHGADFTRQLLTPLSPHTLVLLSGSGWSIERLLRCCVQRVNDIENAPAAAGPTPSYVQRNQQFQLLAKRLRELQVAGVLRSRLSLDPKATEATLLIAPKSDSPELAAKLAEVRRMLNLDADRSEFRLTSDLTWGGDRIAVIGRSLLGVAFFLSQTVAAPQQHEQAGLVTITQDTNGQRFDWREVTGDLLQVRAQQSAPANAFARVRYRGHWFYIDDSDLESKSTFSLMLYLLALQAAGEQGLSPLLTVGVGQ